MLPVISDGDMEIEIIPTRRRDEIGAMTKAIIFFKDNLSQAEDLRQEQKKRATKNRNRTRRQPRSASAKSSRWPTRSRRKS